MGRHLTNEEKGRRKHSMGLFLRAHLGCTSKDLEVGGYKPHVVKDLFGSIKVARREYGVPTLEIQIKKWNLEIQARRIDYILNKVNSDDDLDLKELGIGLGEVGLGKGKEGNRSLSGTRVREIMTEAEMETLRNRFRVSPEEEQIFYWLRKKDASFREISVLTGRNERTIKRHLPENLRVYQNYEYKNEELYDRVKPLHDEGFSPSQMAHQGLIDRGQKTIEMCLRHFGDTPHKKRNRIWWKIPLDISIAVVILYAQGEGSQRKIGRFFGIGQTQVSEIWRKYKPLLERD